MILMGQVYFVENTTSKACQWFDLKGYVCWERDCTHIHSPTRKKCIRKWCEKNACGSVVIFTDPQSNKTSRYDYTLYWTVWFEDVEDIIHFKLSWSGFHYLIKAEAKGTDEDIKGSF